MSIDAVSVFPDLWVLRHGETTWNVEKRLQGRLDSPLTPKGIEQAQAQGAILRAEPLPRDVRVFSSPAGRAWRTAEIATQGLGKPVEPEPALLEIDLGAWQGKCLSDIPEARGASDPHLWKFSGPGCERIEEMAARLTRFLGQLDAPAVLVTHGVTSRMLRCLVLGHAPDALALVPGGQGVVHRVRQGIAEVIVEPGA